MFEHGDIAVEDVGLFAPLFKLGGAILARPKGGIRLAFLAISALAAEA